MWLTMDKFHNLDFRLHSILIILGQVFQTRLPPQAKLSIVNESADHIIKNKFPD